jgi:hypothetical protein
MTPADHQAAGHTTRRVCAPTCTEPPPGGESLHELKHVREHARHSAPPASVKLHDAQITLIRTVADLSELESDGVQNGGYFPAGGSSADYGAR